jgi:3,4-dihydroxy 2-butanone 4-phosphate synthase/GTP cyclohydrolase II
MVILVDEEDRENEGDLVLASDHVTPEAINFMARFGRGLICLTLTRERCEYLKLPPMAARNGTVYSTAFTVSIEAAEGVTTGISPPTAPAPCRWPWPRTPAQRPGAARPHLPAAGRGRRRADARRPHRSRLRPGRHGRLQPSAVICEIMKDDGTMARLPDLQLFAAEHGLKIGTIADLIQYRSRTESLLEKWAAAPCRRPRRFTAHAFRDKPSHAVHLALVKGS